MKIEIVVETNEFGPDVNVNLPPAFVAMTLEQQEEIMLDCIQALQSIELTTARQINGLDA